MIRLIAGGLSLLALAGCHSAAPGNDASPANAATGNETAAMLALPKAQQDIVLFRAIRDAGQDCQDLRDAKRLDDLDGKPTWFVTCDRNRHWLIAMGPGGIAEVTDAARILNAKPR